MTAAIFHIDEHQAQQRLDNFLFAKYRRLPKSYIYRLVRTGQVRINKKRAKPSQKLIPNDLIRVPPMLQSAQTQTNTPPVTNDLKQKCTSWVIYEDDDIIAIDKPPGIAVHADTHMRAGLVELMRAIYKNDQLQLIHRIDKETSGVVLLSKNITSLRTLQDEFRMRRVEKNYQIITDAQASWQNKTVDIALLKQKVVQGHACVVIDEKNGKEAISEFNCVKHFAGTSFLHAKPKTGRTHQLRVHLAHIGLPIIGDPIYAPKNRLQAWRALGIKRLHLHADALWFTHPKTKIKLHIVSRHDLFTQFQKQYAPFLVANNHQHTKP